MTIRVVTDSTSDISPRLAAELGVSIVPLSVIFGDEVFKEGVEIGHDLFYDRLVRGKVHPSTSAPSVGDFLSTYEPLLAETNEIVSIHLSSKLSATYNNAWQAAQQLAERGARIEVIDSLTVSMGLMFIVTAAARAAAGGASLEDIRAIAERMVPNVSIVVTLDTLEYIRRGGRIGRARAMLGTMLRVKPVLTIHDGEVHPGERVRTTKLAHEHLFQTAISHKGVTEAAVGYSTNAQDADVMRQRLKEALPGVNVQIARLGPVLGVHGGPGTLGIGLLEGEE